MANNKQAVTLAYLMANPGDYTDGKTIAEIARDTRVAESTIYNHVRILKSAGIVKVCGTNIKTLDRKALYLDQVAFKASDATSLPIVGLSTNEQEAQLDTINDKLDILLELVSKKAAPTGRPANNKAYDVVIENLRLVKDLEAYRKAIIDTLGEPMLEWEILRNMLKIENINKWVEMEKKNDSE